MQLKDILQAIPVLQEIMGMTVSFNVGFKLQKITNEIDIVTAQYDKARQELLTKYGTLSEDGKEYSFEGESGAEYDKGIEKLMEEKVEISSKKISVDTFKNVELEAGKIRLIAWLLKD